MTDELNFDSLEAISLPVSISGKIYKLVEASGEAIVRYNNIATGAAVLRDGKAVGIKGIADVEPQLVSDCLLYDDKVFEHLNGKNVPIEVVKKFPGRIMQKLFKKAKEISEIDRPVTAKEIRKQIEKLQEQLDELLKDEDELGNDSESTTDG